MRALSIAVFVALLPVSAQAGNSDIRDAIEQVQVPTSIDRGLQGGPELARCRGTKCAGPGDQIRNEPDVQDGQRVAGDRGGQATAGGKKGRRHHETPESLPLLAGDRGGQATAGGKKGRRHHDNDIFEPRFLS